MTKWKIYNEDAVEWAKNYQKGKFHALLTDAPYHLTSIVKRYGKASMSDDTYTSDKARRGADGYSRLARGGFMGATWDGGDVAFRPETWEAFKEVLYPGAFGMAFSASRNWHRMAVAIEDAGFIIHPTMFFLWVQGQGFPKATNISAQLDKRDGLIGNRGKAFRTAGAGDRKDIQGKNGMAGMTYTDPKSELSASWLGHRYGLQALKPSVEPIIVFQKPYEGKPLDNIVSTGAGALNIDGGRIPLATDDEYTINTFDDGAKPFGNGAGHKYSSRKLSNHSRSAKSAKSKGIYGDSSEQDTHQTPGQLIGRWPANLILDEGSAERLDAQTGNLPAGTATANSGAMGYHGGRRGSTPEMTYADNGGASRFFYQVSTQLDEADPFYYCSKVSPKERNAGLDDLSEQDLGHSKYDKCASCGGYIFQSEGRDSKCTCESPERVSNKQRNPHPTLKPIALAKYLATLLLPPAEYAPRRIFIPFSGVASEMIGAGLAGWEHVVGVEFDTENGYVDIAKKRLEHWLK